MEHGLSDAPEQGSLGCVTASRSADDQRRVDLLGHPDHGLPHSLLRTLHARRRHPTTTLRDLDAARSCPARRRLLSSVQLAFIGEGAKGTV